MKGLYSYMKKQMLFKIFLFIFLFNIKNVSATIYLPSQIENNTYIIGSYLFNREKVYDDSGNEIFKGYLLVSCNSIMNFIHIIVYLFI